MSVLGWLTAVVFVGSAIVYVVAMVGWLVTMVRQRDPSLPRRVCGWAAVVAVVALLVNALR